MKQEMKALEARSKSMSEEAYNMASKLLLMKLYRVTGPAKVAAANDHIAMLLEQGVLSRMHACAAALTLALAPPLCSLRPTAQAEETPCSPNMHLKPPSAQCLVNGLLG